MRALWLAVAATLLAACGSALGGLDAGPCAPKTTTIAQLCASTDCGFDAGAICSQPSATRFGYDTWSRGCGYVMHVAHGDVGDAWTYVWDASGTLVAYTFNGVLSAGCAPPVTAGTVPTCAGWANPC